MSRPTALWCRVLGHSWRDEPNPTGLIGSYFRCRRCPTWEVLRAGACGPTCVIRERGSAAP